MSNANLIPVVYIGHKERKVDNVAGSGAVWHGHGDVQSVTPPQWGQLSKHPQVWSLEQSVTPVASAASMVLGDVIPGGALAAATDETPVLGAIPKSGDQFDGVVLYGTDVLPGMIEIGGDLVQLGTVVAAAHSVSGLSVDDWNGLVPQIRDQLLIEHIEVMRAAAKPAADAVIAPPPTPTPTPAPQAAAPTGEPAKPAAAAPAQTEAKPKASAPTRQRRQAAAPTGEVS